MRGQTTKDEVYDSGFAAGWEQGRSQMAFRLQDALHQSGGMDDTEAAEYLTRVCEAVLSEVRPSAQLPEVCTFCKGRPVGNAQTWVDGKPRPPAPCPRCGETNVRAA